MKPPAFMYGPIPTGFPTLLSASYLVSKKSMKKFKALIKCLSKPNNIINIKAFK